MEGLVAKFDEKSDLEIEEDKFGEEESKFGDDDCCEGDKLFDEEEIKDEMAEFTTDEDETKFDDFCCEELWMIEDDDNKFEFEFDDNIEFDEDNKGEFDECNDDIWFEGKSITVARR